MAESSRSTDADVAAPPSNDWEFLSMTSSMTSSMLGLPKSSLDIMPFAHELHDEASDDAPGKSGPAVSSSLHPMPQAGGNLTASGTLLSLHPGGVESSSEPFTEGWVPRRRILFSESPEKINIRKKKPSPSIQSPKAVPQGGLPLKNKPNFSKDLISVESDPVIKASLMASDAHIPPKQDTDRALKEQDSLKDSKDIPMVSVTPSPEKTSQNVNSCKVQAKSPWWSQPPKSLWWAQPSKPSMIWSAAMATAVVGIVFFAYRWHLEAVRNELLKSEVAAKDEYIRKLFEAKRLNDDYSHGLGDDPDGLENSRGLWFHRCVMNSNCYCV